MAGLKIINSGKDHWGTRPLPELARPGVRGTHVVQFRQCGLVSVHASAEASTRVPHTQKEKVTQTGLWKEVSPEPYPSGGSSPTHMSKQEVWSVKVLPWCYLQRGQTTEAHRERLSSRVTLVCVGVHLCAHARVSPVLHLPSWTCPVLVGAKGPHNEKITPAGFTPAWGVGFFLVLPKMARISHPRLRAQGHGLKTSMSAGPQGMWWTRGSDGRQRRHYV